MEANDGSDPLSSGNPLDSAPHIAGPAFYSSPQQIHLQSAANPIATRPLSAPPVPEPMGGGASAESDASWNEGPRAVITVAQLHPWTRLLRYYRLREPRKLFQLGYEEDMAKTLEEYAGRETELFNDLGTMYGEEPALTPGEMDGLKTEDRRVRSRFGDTSDPWREWEREREGEKESISNGLKPTLVFEELTVGMATVLAATDGTWPATPWFPHVAENRIRYTDFSCCGCWRHTPGPKVPNWWYAAGNGWQTVYFKDTRRFDRVQRHSAIHECVVKTGDQPCGFVVTDRETCNNVCLGQGCGCWGMKGTALAAMEEHLATAHGLHRLPKRQWATNLFDCPGLGEALFCMFCQASRQIDAAKGYIDRCNNIACLYLCAGAPSCGRWNTAGAASCISLPFCSLPCFVAPYLARRAAAVLGDIDEPELISCCIALWFPCCSLAQSYRQFRREGVNPGYNLRCCEDCNEADHWILYDRSTASYVRQAPGSPRQYRSNHTRGYVSAGYIATDGGSSCTQSPCDGCANAINANCNCGCLRSLDACCSGPCHNSHEGHCSSASDYCSRNVFHSCPCNSCAHGCNWDTACPAGLNSCCDGRCRSWNSSPGGCSCGGCRGGVSNTTCQCIGECCKLFCTVLGACPC